MLANPDKTEPKRDVSDETHDALQKIVSEESDRVGLTQVKYRLLSEEHWRQADHATGELVEGNRSSHAVEGRWGLPQGSGRIAELQARIPEPISLVDEYRFEVLCCGVRIREFLLFQKESDQQRDLFLGLVSHELKTPLTAISGVLQLQSRDDAKLSVHPSDLESYFDRRKHLNDVLMRQVARLTELIDGLLDLSRIRLGKFSVDPTSCDISKIFRSAVMPRLTLAAAESLLQLRLDAPPQLFADADPMRIEELFINLGMQAIRFSPEGGTVSMKITEETDRGVWRLRVKDQGRPWPKKDRDRLFQPFETAQQGGRMGGAGLGLYLSRQIAELHGGRLTWLEPNGQWGNQLEAELPLKVKPL